ncbi:MAG TPA: ABC transporter ATP-binding protein [Planctomycetota bacterium]|nr:ABC transporter ATP-binding protein [Planctomycetota bacterium]
MRPRDDDAGTADPMLEALAAARQHRSRDGRRIDALRPVDLVVRRGAWVTVTGPSGAGKTTLLWLLAGLDRPTSGRVRLAGEDIQDASEGRLARLRRRLGLVFQDAPMLRRMTAWENVACPLVPRGVAASERRARALALLGRVGLEDRSEARPEELSAGERQRVGVARALVADPEILIADEPTSQLDRASAERVVRVLREAHAAGATVVVATHDPVLLEGASLVLRLERVS